MMTLGMHRDSYGVQGGINKVENFYNQESERVSSLS